MICTLCVIANTAKMTADGFAANAKGDEKKEFENKFNDKSFRCEQEKKLRIIEGAYCGVRNRAKTELR